VLKTRLKLLVVRHAPKKRFRKLIFLDRDGVINRFPGFGAYVTSQKAFHWLPGALKAIRRLSEAGFEINVISNQGCVAHRLISVQALRGLTLRMLKEIKKAGGEVQGVFCCPHKTSDGCLCKKPNIVLFKKALRRRRFDLEKVFFIGDSKEDVQASKNLGCQALLVLSGRTRRKDLKTFEPKPDVVKKNLLEAALWITQKKS